MIQLNLLTIEEYKPINGQRVDLFLANRAWNPIIGLDLKEATCEIHYQEFCGSDRTRNSTWTSDTTENMLKIPFNTPFVHITEPIPGQDRVSKIIGFRILEEHEFEKIAEATYHWKQLQSILRFQRTEDMSKPDAIDWAEAVEECEESYAPFKDIPVAYYEKDWLFKVGDNGQIDSTDQDNELIGIVDSDYLSEQFKES